jgi:hypothetical protein
MCSDGLLGFLTQRRVKHIVCHKQAHCPHLDFACLDLVLQLGVGVGLLDMLVVLRMMTVTGLGQIHAQSLARHGWWWLDMQEAWLHSCRCT